MKFLVFISTIDIFLTGVTLVYYRLMFKKCRGSFFTSLYLLFSANIILSRLLPDAYPLEFLYLETYIADFWLGLLYYSFLLSLVHGVIYAVGWLIRVHLPNQSIAGVMMVALSGIYCYGCWNAYQPVVRHENIATAKLEQGVDLRLVVVSDVHLGRVLGREFSIKLVELINSQQPDVVIIAGDLADGKLSYITRGNALEPLSKLRASRGVYMAFGNHDYLDNAKRWQRLAKLQKIKVLNGSSTAIMNGTVKITGLIDFSRDGGTEALRQLAVGNDDFFSILIDHQPRRMLAAEEERYDLYLAGHTHTGQLFPNRLFTYLVYDLDYGRKNYGSMTAIVSSGIGFWGPPARSGVSPEIVVIDVAGTKKL